MIKIAYIFHEDEFCDLEGFRIGDKLYEYYYDSNIKSLFQAFQHNIHLTYFEAIKQGYINGFLLDNRIILEVIGQHNIDRLEKILVLT